MYKRRAVIRRKYTATSRCSIQRTGTVVMLPRQVTCNHSKRLEISPKDVHTSAVTPLLPIFHFLYIVGFITNAIKYNKNIQGGFPKACTEPHVTCAALLRSAVADCNTVTSILDHRSVVATVVQPMPQSCRSHRCVRACVPCTVMSVVETPLCFH